MRRTTAKRSWASIGVAGMLTLAGCGDEPVAAATGADAATPGALVVPAGFPEPPIPEANPYSAAKAELGRFLFYDTRLSANGTQSCASCHEQARAFTDGRARAEGSTGERTPHNALALVNVAYNTTLNWAHPELRTLEQQIRIPLFGEFPLELGAGLADRAILDRLVDDPRYRALFAAAWPHICPEADTCDLASLVDWDHVIGALATFVRGLISGDSPFDRAAWHDEPEALSPAAQRGAVLFFSETLECHHCHGGFNFTLASTHAAQVGEPPRFHNTGLYNVDGVGAYPTAAPGVFGVTGRPEDMGQFRAPSLRNVAVTAPYMHDGSVPTLEAVIRIYEAGGRLIESGPNAGDGRVSPLKSGFVNGFRLTDAERADLVAFLESLTDEGFLTDPRFANPFEAGDVALDFAAQLEPR